MPPPRVFSGRALQNSVADRSVNVYCPALRIPFAPVALNLEMECQIAEVTTVCDRAGGRKRSPKKLGLSLDEWSVCRTARSGVAVNGREVEAPHLLEEVCNEHSPGGGLLNLLVRNADRVKLACPAQLMNVIVPIMTNENGLFRQTIESATSEVNGMGQVPYLDVAGTVSAEGGRASIFSLNRDLSQPHSLGRTRSRVLAAFVLSGHDLKASNSFHSPLRVPPRLPAQPLLADSSRTLEVPARSCPSSSWQPDADESECQRGSRDPGESFRAALVRKTNRFSSPSSLTSESSPGSEAYLAALFEGSAAQCGVPFAGGLAPIV